VRGLYAGEEYSRIMESAECRVHDGLQIYLCVAMRSIIISKHGERSDNSNSSDIHGNDHLSNR
jgi:hypothetical protein